MSRPIASPSQRRLTRRRFHATCAGALASLLAACGGGTDGPRALVPTLRRSRASDAAPGLRHLAPVSIAGPGPATLRAKSLSLLSDGSLGVAWTLADGSDPAAPWRARVQRLDGTGAGSGPVVLLPLALSDPQAAVEVLPDGGSVVARRELVKAAPGDAAASATWRLWVQRFDPAGAPLAEIPLSVVTFNPRVAEDAWQLDPPAIAHWVDGSFVVAWTRVQQAGKDSPLLAEVQALRFHANAEPDLPVATISTSRHDRSFTLEAPATSGGYVIAQETGEAPDYRQSLRLLRPWHPLPSAAFDGLLPGSFLLSLGACGWILFAARADGTGEGVTANRERFDWAGQPVGAPEEVEELPSAAIALEDGDYLALAPADKPGCLRAQRMNKSGETLGAPFTWLDGPHALVPGGPLAVVRAERDPDANWSLVLHRFVDRVELGVD